MRNGYYLYAYIEINEYANYYKTDTKRQTKIFRCGSIVMVI